MTTLEAILGKRDAIDQTAALLSSSSGSKSRWQKVLRRTEAGWADVAALLPALAEVTTPVAYQVTCDIKYAGYLARQEVDIERQKRLSEKRIPSSFDYGRIGQLRAEARKSSAGSAPLALPRRAALAGSPQPTWPWSWSISKGAGRVKTGGV